MIPIVIRFKSGSEIVMNAPDMLVPTELRKAFMMYHRKGEDQSFDLAATETGRRLLFVISSVESIDGPGEEL